MYISALIPCLSRFHIIKPESIPIRYFNTKIYLGIQPGKQKQGNQQMELLVFH